MFAHDLYRRALETLAGVDRVQVTLRSVSYSSREHSPQCATIRKRISFVAPHSIWSTVFGCTPVAEPERSDLIQVGEQAYHRQPTITGEIWSPTKPPISTPEDLPAFLAGMMGLPLPDRISGHGCTAFGIPVWIQTIMRGRERWSVMFSIETLIRPRTLFPGIRPPHGAAPLVRRGDSWERPVRVVESGRLFIDHITAVPLRYVSAQTATLGDETTMVLNRSQVRFRYDRMTAIELPPVSTRSDQYL